MPIINMVYKKKKWWKPWANTIAYYPLTSTSTVNDMSGNNYNLTNTNVTFWTYGWVDCAYFNGSGSRLENSSPSLWLNRTLVAWVYVISNSGNKWVICTGNDYSSNIFGCSVWSSWVANMSDWNTENILGNTVITWWWHLITATLDNGWASVLYVDWVQENTHTFSISSGTWICIWAKTNQHSEKYYGYISNAIIEDKARTAQETSDYYNQTKANYWL